MQTLDLLTGYNLSLRIKVNRRWEELEKKNQQPTQLSRKELAFLVIEAEQEKERALEQVAIQQRELKIQAPKVEYFDNVMQSNSTFSTTIIAKELGMSAIALNKLLHTLGVQYLQSGTWVLYSKHQDKGYTKTKTTTFTDRNGETRTSILLVWTEKGRKFIHDTIKSIKHIA